MNGPEGTEPDLGLIAALEAAAVRAWPAAHVERGPGGWLLRSTPGLDRGRSNNALPPCRALSEAEIAVGVEAVEAFARSRGIRPGIQVSPLELQRPLLLALQQAGWESQMSVVVLAAAPRAILQSGSRDRLALEVSDRATPGWLNAWAVCEGRTDVEAHAATVFAALAGRARFVRDGERAVGIAVPDGRLVGLFCLAVHPELRRRGLGSALVRAMVGLPLPDPEVVYLQVESRNAPALAMYERLGFERLYRYCHVVAPAR